MWVGDALHGVVDGDGEMVGGRRVLAGEDDVAVEGGVGVDAAGFRVLPDQRAGPPGGCRHV